MTLPGCVACLTAVLATGCATLRSAPLAAEWTRDVLRESVRRCEKLDCRTTLNSPRGRLVVTTSARLYEARDIPGWDSSSSANRVASAAAGQLLRVAGAKTDNSIIGLGTRAVTDSQWRLSCTVYWIDDDEVGYTRAVGNEITGSKRRTQGWACSASPIADSTAVRWRFRRGVAPPRDSVARLYDSLATAQSSAVSSSPPMLLERLTADGTTDASYAVVEDPRATSATGVPMRVSRDDGVPIAIVHRGFQVTVDVAPSATAEEARVVRLLAAAMLLPLRQG